MNAKKPRYFHLTPSRKKLAKYIAHGNKVSIVKQFLREPQYKELIIVQIGLLIQRELRALASRKGNSLLRNRSKEAFLSFSWDSMWQELVAKTPTLLTILETVLSCKTMSLSKIQPILCIIIAILAKFINPALNLVQSYISILLYAGHCSKQVHNCTLVLIHFMHYAIHRYLIGCKS